MKKTITYVSIAILILCLGACTQSGPSTKMNVNMSDFAFTPNQFTVPAGEEITLQVSHNGVVEHDFIVMKLGTDAGPHFNAEDEPNVYWQIKVQPGASQTITMTAPDKPGIYQIVCGMPGHVEAGMIGALEVVVEQ
jgi:uncharacterized cupredoxin-like copper-binding protein